MKLDKREITLNEADSIRDVLETEKTLLRAYASKLEYAERKETRAKLLEHLNESGKNVYCVVDWQEKTGD